MEFFTVATSETSLPSLLEKLKQSCAKRSFSIQITHNFKSKFEEKQIPYDGTECAVVEICQPFIAASVIKSNRMIALALPCRIMIFSEKPGDALKLSTMYPTKLIKMMESGNEKNEVAEREAVKVEALIKEIMEEC